MNVTQAFLFFLFYFFFFFFFLFDIALSILFHSPGPLFAATTTSHAVLSIKSYYYILFMVSAYVLIGTSTLKIH